MVQINPYISFNGNCEKAFHYYKSIFGGEFPSINRYSEMPPKDGKSISPVDAEKIMHISLPISKETVLMGCDIASSFGSPTVFGNNFSVCLLTDSKKEADRIFNSLSAGGQISMPMMDTFWAAYFGMCTDKFGISWMVNVDLKAIK